MTPLLLKSLPDEEGVVIEVDKEGFIPKQLLVPVVPGAVVTLSPVLRALTREYLAEASRRDFASYLNDNLRKIFDLQRAIIEQDKGRVLALEQEMKESWKAVSFFHSLMGNFYFLSGNRNEARLRYQKALSLDAENSEARAMFARLKDK